MVSGYTCLDWSSLSPPINAPFVARLQEILNIHFSFMSILAGDSTIAVTDESIQAVDKFMWGFPDFDEGFIPNALLALLMSELGWDGKAKYGADQAIFLETCDELI